MPAPRFLETPKSKSIPFFLCSLFIKVTLNGRQGLVVSGGQGAGGMRSVEFYDVSTGQWVSLPPLVTGRRGHSMMVQAGRMMVLGGMASNNTYLADMEVFNGER